MVVEKPLAVKTNEITSLDIVSVNGGLDERGEYNSEPNTFVYGRNVMPDPRGLLTHRYVLRRWLPDTVETVYEIFPAIYEGDLFHITADDGKIKYCQDGDTSWTDAGGDNTITTGDGVITTFLRILDKVFILNGQDKLAYLDLTNMEVVKYLPVVDPANAPTVTGTGITVGSGSFKIYYAVSFNSSVGETAISPIGTFTISKDRNTWKTDGTEYLTVARNNTTPTNAVSWNLYVSTKAAGGTIAATDMLPLASGVDISVTDFVDNGALPIDLSRGTAPEDNSTEGMTCTYGIETGGRPILYGDVDNPYNVWIGGDGDNATDFSPNNGGYRAELNKGTNYYPMGVIGFRNGQGIPSLTVLFSNTKGLSKQSVLEQQTVTYGDISFVVWAVTEQNYGSAGVASPYGALNYLGGLHFPSTDGFVTGDTEASLQNVLSFGRISDRVEKTVGSIKNELLIKIVGTAWNNRVLWAIPSRGYDYNNEILIYDLTLKDKPIWYKWDIRAQWIGVVSPNNAASFVYVCQDNHIYRLVEGYIAADESPTGQLVPFPTEARGGFVGLNQSHNSYKAIVQVLFYLLDGLGDVTIGVTYRNEDNVVRTKTKVVPFAEYEFSSTDGWDSPSVLYETVPSEYLEWDSVYPTPGAESVLKDTRRVPIPMDVIANELQWSISTGELDFSSYTMRSVSYEGVTLGAKVDLR